MAQAQSGCISAILYAGKIYSRTCFCLIFSSLQMHSAREAYSKAGICISLLDPFCVSAVTVRGDLLHSVWGGNSTAFG